MGWFNDVKGGLKKAGKATVGGLDKASDALIDKKAWSHTAQALLDGPGGKEVKMGDLANIALDASMLVPGVGVAGGAARVAGRQALKTGAKAAAHKVEQTALKDSLRSGANVAVRKKARGVQADMVERLGVGAAKATGKGTGKRIAAKEGREGAVKRIAAKQEAGIGKKVGFGQTKKRILKTAGATMGANVLARGWDEGLSSLLDGDKGNAGQGYGPQKGGAGGAGAGGGAGFYLVGSDGSSTPMPADLQKALAGFMNQGGSPDGQQVIYLGN